MPKPLIALDADGVLLDYSLAYAGAWERAFGKRPQERDPSAYWPTHRWDVERLQGTKLELFRTCFDHAFWIDDPSDRRRVAGLQRTLRRRTRTGLCLGSGA